MGWIDPRYVEHQRKRFLRHDWERYIRPDWERFMRPDWRDPKYWEGGVPPAHLIELAERNARRKPAPLPQDIEAAEQEIERERLALPKSIDALRLELAEAKSELAFRRLLRALATKAYNPNQPRVPKGSREGGQWTSDGSPGSSSELTEFSAAGRDKAVGHHYVHQSLYNKLPLPPETLKVFEEGNTGRLQDATTNKYDTPHRIYNQAVKEHFERFLEANRIQVDKMTPSQAHKFLDEIMESKDPRIRNFNMRIWLREIMKRGPLRWRGNE